ncbi:hypothetical protein Salat_2608800 [Sesamum alatum]|uniref:GRF-type domain-containing protein n=1 Tax=Sesamum alatum TaxID=300844 RepID=A0AAE1XP50_9LAMI|nr:hypothetical protein Salat_2608800 [Sesamum alatum]
MPVDNGSWSEETDTSSIPRSTTFGNQSRGSSSPFVMRICICGNETVVRTSWTNNNPGRRFRACAGYNGSYCGSFEWVDPPMCRRARDVIPGLLRCIKQYEIEEQHARAREGRLEASKRRFRMLLRLVLIVWGSSLLVMALAVCCC